MQMRTDEALYLETVIRHALTLNAVVLMKINTIRTHGKTPELLLAEGIIAAHRMHQSLDSGEPV